MSNNSDWAEDTEQSVLDRAVELAPLLGWSDAMVREAVVQAGLDTSLGELLLPNGPADLAALLASRFDRVTLERLNAANPVPMKIRDRIRLALVTHLEVSTARPDATRRWAGFLALPTNIPLALRLVWASADMIWRWTGDTATDENHYSKRAMLSIILITALARDLSHGREAAEVCIDARIANVMAFEKWKAGQAPLSFGPQLVQALARLRYG